MIKKAEDEQTDQKNFEVVMGVTQNSSLNILMQTAFVSVYGLLKITWPDVLC